MIFEGRCWTFGDNVPADRLVKSKYVFEPMTEIVRYILEDLNPAFPRDVQPGDIVVAGRHFGQSSGRAIAAKALKATGIGCVVAQTFARLRVDVAAGMLENLTAGQWGAGPPASPFLLDMLAAGGRIRLAAQRPGLFGG